MKGKASPRHERPFSGKRSGYASRNTNTKANIFGISEPSARDKSFKQDLLRTHSDGSVRSTVKYSTPNAPRGSDAVSIPSVS